MVKESTAYQLIADAIAALGLELGKGGAGAAAYVTRTITAIEGVAAGLHDVADAIRQHGGIWTPPDDRATGEKG